MNCTVVMVLTCRYLLSMCPMTEVKTVFGTGEKRLLQCGASVSLPPVLISPVTKARLFHLPRYSRLGTVARKGENSVPKVVKGTGSRVLPVDQPDKHGPQTDRLRELGLLRQEGAILAVDLVESVRRMQVNEVKAIADWVDFVQRITSHILPRHQGRLVKSLGDGFLAEFRDVPGAVAATFEIVREAMTSTRGVHLPLRSGIETGQFVAGDIDIYGHAVNMASRLAGLAAPGDVMISEAVRDRLTPGLDASLVDLGFQMVKHVEGPLRVFRIAPQDMPAPIVAASPTDLIPAIAFVPLNAHETNQNLTGIGDIICEELIRWMSPARQFRVISRPSTAPFRQRTQTPLWIGNHLKAQFVVTGTYALRGSQLVLSLTCMDCVRQNTIWQHGVSVMMETILEGELPVLGSVVEALAHAIAHEAVHQVGRSELDTVENYNLMLAAVALINRLNRADFEQAHRLLDLLCQRLPQAALPHAWLGHWHNMRVQQGWSTDPLADSRLALEACKASLDRDPQSSLALAISGLIYSTLEHRLDEGRSLLSQAVRINPNDPLAWLFLGVNQTFSGNGSHAVFSSKRACHLAPFDPARYLYESLTASAYMMKGDPHEALAMAERSLSSNLLHSSSHRVRVLALHGMGQGDAARAAAKEFLQVDPAFRVGKWLELSPLRHIKSGKDYANALRDSGLPD